jgi:predicted nucleic acid-binding protein
VIVLDASVWVSTLRSSDVNFAASRDWLAGWNDDGKLIYVPRLFLAEVSGAVARTSGMPGVGRKAVEDALGNPFVSLVTADDALLDSAARYAADLLLRGTDAVYVALAVRLQLPLITWDQEQLSRAATLIEVRTPAI